MEDDISAANGSSHSVDTKSNKQKMKKIEWTPELHKKFVEAVDQLGVEQAVPSRILKFMKVEGLTRQNIASHLQKYRKLQRQSLSQARYSTIHWSFYYSHKHVMAFPTTYHSNYQIGHNGVPMMLHADVWGYPVEPPSLGSCPTNLQLQADVWGYPVGHSSLGSCPTYPQNASGYYSAEADWMQNNMRNNIPEKSFDDHHGEEMIDKVVNEVLSKPWLPLPLGLKFHSIDTVLHEFPDKGDFIIPQPNKWAPSSL